MNKYLKILIAALAVAGIAFGQSKLSDIKKEQAESAGIIPAGVIMPYAGGAVPDGWVLCDGSPISRTTYARLFSAISTTWGAGDGSTTFNVPDLRGRYLRGAGAPGDGNGGDNISLGSFASDQNVQHSHSIAHDHAAVTSGTQSANHTHSASDSYTFGHSGSSANSGRLSIQSTGGGGVVTGSGSAISISIGSNSVNHTHSVNLPNFSGNSGNSGSSVEARPNSYGVNYIIKV